MIKLYNYFRSSASFRVRIALNFKGLPYDYAPVHLLKGGGEQLAASFRTLNPDSLVPVLDDDGAVLTQSLAIIEYLEETRPTPPLLPRDAHERAYVRSIALAIACDIHPLNNLRVLRYLVRTLAVSEEQKNAWYRHWIEHGLASLEARLIARSALRPLHTRRHGDTGRCRHRAADIQRAADGLQPELDTDHHAHFRQPHAVAGVY